jgi:hypothetical protein
LMLMVLLSLKLPLKLALLALKEAVMPIMLPGAIRFSTSPTRGVNCLDARRSGCWNDDVRRSHLKLLMEGLLLSWTSRSSEMTLRTIG